MLGKSSERYKTKLIIVFAALAVGIMNFQVSGQYVPVKLLDPSWCEVLDYNSTQTKRFGVDIIFAYGPLGYLFCENSLGNHELIRIGYAAFYVIVLASLSVRLLKRLTGMMFVLTTMWLVVMLDLEGGAYFIIGMSGVCLCQIYKWQIIDSVLIAMALGVLSLIKFSLLMPIAVILTIALGNCIYRYDFMRALVVICVFCITIMGLWQLLGQMPEDLLVYFLAGAEIAKGYVAGMNSIGDLDTVMIAIAAGIAYLLIWINCLKFDANKRHVFVLIVSMVLMVVLWKRAVVRIDYHHTMHYFQILPLLATMGLVCSADGVNQHDRCRLKMCVLYLICVIGLYSNASRFVLKKINLITDSIFQVAFYSQRVVDLVTNEIKPTDVTQFAPEADRLSKIKHYVGDDSIDLINYEQGLLFLNGLNYQGRPVFQSYAAYTELLAQINVDYFAGPKSPKFVIMNPSQTIDHRLPMMDDGPAKIMILQRYQSVMSEAGYVLMEKKGNSANLAKYDLLINKKVKIGEKLDLSDYNSSVLLIGAEWQQNLLGSSVASLLQELPMRVEIETAGGVNNYRLIQEMLKSPIMLSPQLTSDNDVLMLQNHDWTSLTSKRVISIRFVIMPDRYRQYERFARNLFEQDVVVRIYKMSGI